MARFRNNQQQVVVEPVYQRDGLRIERVRRFDQTALLPVSDRWSAWSFRITTGGTRHATYAQQRYALAPNTILWHSPLRDPVKTHALPGTGSEVLVLAYSAQRWDDFLQHSPAFRAQNAALLERWPGQPLLALQLAPPQMLHVLRQLVTLSRLERVPVQVIENNSRMLQRLLGDLCFDVAIQSREDERRRRVELAQARMVARLSNPPSLQQIADDLSVSPRQLQRDFLAVTGLTPIRYLNVVRLSEANSLLAESSLPISEIAALLGYVSIGHFSAAFRQAYNCSPRQVRSSRATALIEPPEGAADDETTRRHDDKLAS